MSLAKIYDRERDSALMQEHVGGNVHKLDEYRDSGDLLALYDALGLDNSPSEIDSTTDTRPDLKLIQGRAGQYTLKEKLLVVSPAILLGSVAAVQMVKAL